MVGDVPAAGLTPDQVQAKIEEKLRAGRYITQPHASVAVVVYRPFYILGEVSSPEAYSYVSGMKGPLAEVGESFAQVGAVVDTVCEEMA